MKSNLLSYLLVALSLVIVSLGIFVGVYLITGRPGIVFEMFPFLVR